MSLIGPKGSDGEVGEKGDKGIKGDEGAISPKGQVGLPGKLKSTPYIVGKSPCSFFCLSASNNNYYLVQCRLK